MAEAFTHFTPESPVVGQVAIPRGEEQAGTCDFVRYGVALRCMELRLGRHITKRDTGRVRGLFVGIG